jgi:energy-coupling factor transporter ATP-binding protein EcfA2
MNAGLEEAVLITGVYGSGKSSVAQEMAYLLEKQSAPYALLDLDFLGWWADTGSGGRPAWLAVMLKNLAALVGNYLAVGVRFFVLAGSIRDLGGAGGPQDRALRAAEGRQAHRPAAEDRGSSSPRPDGG